MLSGEFPLLLLRCWCKLWHAWCQKSHFYWKNQLNLDVLQLKFLYACHHIFLSELPAWQLFVIFTSKWSPLPTRAFIVACLLESANSSILAAFISAVHKAAGRTVPGFAWYNSWKCHETVHGEWSLRVISTTSRMLDGSFVNSTVRGGGRRNLTA